MKALIIRGKYKGIIAEVGQYCNDWFTLDTGTEIDTKPFSPSSLAFNYKDLTTILEDKSTGIMRGLFKPDMYRGEVDRHEKNGPNFNWTFKRIKI